MSIDFPAIRKGPGRGYFTILLLLLILSIFIFQIHLNVSVSEKYLFTEYDNERDLESHHNEKDAETRNNDKNELHGELDAEEKRMNIVLLYADDWRFDSLGALNPIIETPFLDKLAQQGMLFTQNAVTTSICWISRACLATGQHYARHKSRNLSDPVPFHEYWNETLFGKLRNNGYITGAVGKWQPGQMQEYMFNHSEIYSGFHFQEKDHITDMNERDALHFLRNVRKEHINDPFALFVNFFAPHHHDGEPEQYFPQEETKKLYQNIIVPFAPTCTDEAWQNLPYFFDERNEGRLRWRKRFDEPTKAQKMIKNYFRLISGVDTTCGKILEELERQKLTENTLVIFTTDNGYYHAEHGLAEKFYAHQESIRVPLIIKDPRMNKDLIGTRNDDFTLSIDLAPTMLEAANILVPDRMQGTDMTKLYTGDTTSAKTKWRKSFYYDFPGVSGSSSTKSVQALVRKDFKYMYWPEYKYEELFYLPSDPHEETNLALIEKFEPLLEELRGEFKKVQAEAE